MEILCHIANERKGKKRIFFTRTTDDGRFQASKVVDSKKIEKFLAWVRKTSQGISVSGLGSQRRGGVIYIYRY